MFDASSFRGLALVGVPAFIALPSTFGCWSWVADIANERQHGAQGVDSVLELATRAGVDLELARLGRSLGYSKDPWPQLDVGNWYTYGGSDRVYAQLPDWVDRGPFTALVEMMEGGRTAWGGLLADLRELGVDG